MVNRAYRYFDGKPLYPFGYGLSYTSFSYDGLTIPTQAVNPGQPIGASVTVTNTGKVTGDETVQLYLKFPPVKGAPNIALRGFQRIHLEPCASQKVHFELKSRDLGMVTDEGKVQSSLKAITQSISVEVNRVQVQQELPESPHQGQIDLPE